MAPGIKIGCTIHALANKVMGSKWSKQRYGLAWKTKELRGTVTSMIGTGRSRKWNCYFEELSISRALSARSLIISGQDTLPPQQLTPASVNECSLIISGQDTIPPQQLTPASVNEQGDNDAELDEEEGVDEMVDGENEDITAIDENGDADEMQQEESAVQENQESSKNDPLNCNGVLWSVVSNNVSEDTRVQPCYRAMILWDTNTEEEKRTVLDYFKLSFPMQMMDSIVAWTSQATPPGKKGINSGTILKLFGYLLALTRTTARRRNLFSECDGLFPAPRFGARFGLSQHRTDMLLRSLRFCPLTDVDKNDKWSPVRRLIDGFNLRRVELFYPSWQICVDESMSAWRGKDGNFCSDGLPHVSKIERKPKGVGTELKDAADTETKVIIQLEIQEGKEEMEKKEYMDVYKKAGTAQVLRLTKPWHGTGRAVYADSAFASVTTAIACRQKGLHFTGLVKTATTKFPKKFLDSWEYKELGDSVTLVAQHDGYPLIAHGWGGTR